MQTNQTVRVRSAHVFERSDIVKLESSTKLALSVALRGRTFATRDAAQEEAEQSLAGFMRVTLCEIRENFRVHLEIVDALG